MYSVVSRISALLSVRDVLLLVRACFLCSPLVEVQQSDVWKGQSKTMVKEVIAYEFLYLVLQKLECVWLSK